MSDAPDPALALLTLTHWLSPAFPTGAFAYSHGLETAVARGEVADASGARDWIADVLDHGTGWNDAVLLAQALRPGADLPALADLAEALAGSGERLAETRALGAAFTRGVNALQGLRRPDWPFPVALGAAAAPLGLPPATVIALALQAFATNLATIAIRFVPLGQSEGMAVLADLRPLILRLAERAARAGVGDLRAAALRADLHAIWHEEAEPRMFRS